MKTLVIHPKDFTTDFLSIIYADKNFTVITDNHSNSKLRKLIKSHERIIMLGHGTEYGLIGHKRLMVDSRLVNLLRDKPNNIYIWCHADQFVRKYGLKGFATGMIISEIEEAILYCVNFRTSTEITFSNDIFALAVKNAVDLPVADMVPQIKKDYFSQDNNVMMFNQENLFYFP